MNSPPITKKYDALYLKVFDRSGEEIYCYSWKIGGNLRAVSQLVKMDISEQEKQQREKLKAAGIEADNILPIEQQSADLSKENGVAELTENDSLFILKASGIAVTFSRKDGRIRKVTNDLGLPIPFSNGPVLVSGNARLESIQARKGEKSCSLEMSYSGDMRKVIWTMFSSGWLAMDYEYQVAGEQKFCGISFDFPESDVIWHQMAGQRSGARVEKPHGRRCTRCLPADVQQPFTCR